MIGLKEMLTKEENRLRKIKRIVDERLNDAPEGTLRVNASERCVQYALYGELGKTGEIGVDSDFEQRKNTNEGVKKRKTRSYIKKEDMPLVRSLAQKSYDQKVKKLVDRRLKQVERLGKEYSDGEIDELYYDLSSIRKSLVDAVEKPWEQKLQEWKSVPYVGKEFRPGIPEIFSKKGERVRSKSEKILADTFYAMGIDYKYECPLNLKGMGTVYPDFTILRKRDGREIYWEHDGKMEDPEYAQKAIRKINSYIANGIFPGDNLIVSFESANVLINDKIINRMISKYIL